MLYDPKWEQQTRADPFTLESLIAWLEKQPADTAYDYCRPDICLVAQYLKAHEIKNYSVASEELNRLIPGLHQIARDCIDSPQDWTFGGALKRARTLAAQASGAA